LHGHAKKRSADFSGIVDALEREFMEERWRRGHQRGRLRARENCNESRTKSGERKEKNSA